MADVANVLLPIFAVIALGAGLRNGGFASPQVFRETNRIVYWVALPAYLFYKTAESQLPGDAAARVFAVLFGVMLLSIALGYAIARLLQLSPRSTSAFVQGAYRSNLAYVGLPIVLLAVQQSGGSQIAALQALSVISIALLVPIYNFAAVFVLLSGRESTRGELPQRLRELLLRLVTNPLILACAAGMLVMVLGWKLPQPLRETAKIVGDMATPLALLGIGAALSFGTLRAHVRNATAAAGIKAVAGPLLGLLLGGWLGMSRPELRISLIFLACPTAGASYIMAQQLGSDDSLAANIVVMSTLLALPALAFIVALT
ncbi:MAG: AEC family transporter [Nitrososphaerales archaeon]